MIKILTTRPLCWDGKQSENIIIKAIDIGDKLKNGAFMLDGVGTVMTKGGKRRMLEAFEEFRPDYFIFAVHFGFFSLAFLKHLRTISPKTVFVHWSGNQVLTKEHKMCWYTFEMKPEIDIVFTNTSDEILKSKIGKRIPEVYTLYDFGFDPNIFTESNVQPEIDCFFGGGNTVHSKRKAGRFPFSKSRYDIMKRINEEYSLEVRGGGWPFGSKPGLQGLDYFRAMQRAKIIIGNYHLDLERYYTKRTVYSGASGRPYLVRYIPGMEKDFENEYNIIWYKTEDECFEFLDYYLSNHSEREELGKTQRLYFEEHHSWDARFRDLDRLIVEIESK